MNAKLCKKLRRTAREMAADMPDREIYVIPGNGMMINKKKTFRGVYRFLKQTVLKGYKQWTD